MRDLKREIKVVREKIDAVKFFINEYPGNDILDDELADLKDELIILEIEEDVQGE